MALNLNETNEQFARRCAQLQERIQSPDFLANRGLGNEVGFFTFCYSPARELEMRAFVARLAKSSEDGALACRIIHRDLYDLLLQICEEKRILGAIPKQEEKRGSQALLKQLQKTASTEAFARAVDYDGHQPGDVVVITGAGEVYPVLRIHSLLENLHALLDDVPTVIFYPGSFDGQQFRLFGGSGLSSESYYRAFDISAFE